MALKIDGDLSVDGTKDACEQKQREGFQLTSIKADKENALGQEVLENVAEFDEALSPDILDVLNFVSAPATEKVEDVKTRTPGWTFICDAPELYVDSKLERRVVFGKKSA